MRIGIGKKIGSVYVGVSKSFGGKSKGGGGCLGAIAVLFALPFILIYGFVVAVIAIIKKIAEWTKEWDIKHKIILWVSIGGGFLVLIVIGCIVSPPQSGGNNNIVSKSTTTSTLTTSPKAYDTDDLWITEAETTSVHTTTTAVVTPEPEEEEETEPAIAETDTSESEETNAENEEAQENNNDEDTEEKENDEVTVYITNTGKRYHYDSHCGNGDYFETTLDNAIGMGLKPCKKCVE